MLFEGNKKEGEYIKMELDKKQLKEMLREIAKEKKAKKLAVESKQSELDAMLEKMTEKMATKFAEVIASKSESAGKPVTEDPSKKSAFTKEQKITEFFKAVISGNKKVSKALSEGTDANGGYLVPDEFRNNIVDWAQDKPVIRNYATVWPMKEKTLELPALAADVQVYWGSENTSISTTSMDFGNVLLTVHKLNALIFLSSELFEDSEIDIVNYITGRFAQAIFREEDRKFILGTGTGQPKGISQYTISSVDKLSLGTPDDLIAMFWRLPQSHRENAVFLADSLNIEKLATTKDLNGNYILKMPTEGGIPKIQGRPVLEQNDCGKDIYFGDPRFYYVGDRRKMSVKSTDTGAGTFEKDQVAIKVTERVDGQLALARAFRKVSNYR